MPVTTSDWLRLIESISSVPSDREAVVRRLQAGGVEGDRAEWLVSVARRQRIGRAFERAGMFIVVVGLMWMMVYWFLALTGSPDAPGLIAMMPPFVVTFAGTVALAIGAVLNTVLDMDLFAFPRVPPELPPPPRNVRSGRRQKHIVILLAGQVCLLVSVISMTTLPHVRNAVWLRQHGVETTGRVVERYTHKGSKGQVSYYLRYTFPNGDGVASVDRARYDATKVGDTTPVTYLPSRPEISEPVPKQDLTLERLVLSRQLLLGVGVVIAILSLVPLVIRNAVRRQQQIAERGTAVVGRVTEVRAKRVNYAFPTPSGEVSGFVFLNKRKLRTRAMEGSPLAILYQTDDPRRNVALGALDDFELG